MCKHKNFGRGLFLLPICVIMEWVMQVDKESKLPKRKEIRLKSFDYSSPGVYFITICTESRKNYFWNAPLDPQAFEWHSVGANCVRPQNLPLSDIGNTVSVELEKWHKAMIRCHCAPMLSCPIICTFWFSFLLMNTDDRRAHLR